MRKTIFDLQAMKRDGEPIVMLTVYDHASALIAERAGVPLFLVGDSVGMVVHGHDTTLPVTIEDMIFHARMVVRGSHSAFVVADMPFLTYADVPRAVTTARRLMQEGGAQAVKLEGGAAVVPVVKALSDLGVPVMGHLGFTPQSQHMLGIRVRGREVGEGARLVRDALALEAAGAFALVLELVPAELAAHVARTLTIPVIGIGAGVGCDGQVQVWHDVLGLSDGKTPRHARRFAEIGAQMGDAIRDYAQAVRTRQFPAAAQSPSMKREVLAEILGGAN